MLDSIAVKLIENTPLALTVLGAVLLLIGAMGGLPKPRFEVRDLSGRLALGVIGTLVISFGAVLIWSGPTYPVQVKKDYGIKITSPRPNTRVSEQFDVEGTYTTKPPDRLVWIIEYRPDSRDYWPKVPVSLNTSSNNWYAPISVGGGDMQKIDIIVAAVGPDGQALLEYSLRVGEHADEGRWVSIKTLPSDFFERDRVTVIRERRPAP